MFTSSMSRNTSRFSDHDSSFFGGSSKPESGLRHIANDVWISSQADNRPTIIINSRLYYRFLDRLYIPCKTTALSGRQICTINRFRERAIDTDPQFNYRNEIRGLFSRSLQTLPSLRVIEIGSGSFPFRLTNFVRYSSLEIDILTIQHLKSLGIDIVGPAQSSDNYDLCVGLFVFHFDVSLSTLEKISALMKPGGLFVFNVVTSAADVRTLAFSRLSRLGYSGLCIDLKERFKKNDAIFICHSGARRLLAMKLYSNIVGEIERSSNDDVAS
jgi:hypothetical protein